MFSRFIIFSFFIIIILINGSDKNVNVKEEIEVVFDINNATNKKINLLLRPKKLHLIHIDDSIYIKDEADKAQIFKDYENDIISLTVSFNINNHEFNGMFPVNEHLYQLMFGKRFILKLISRHETCCRNELHIPNIAQSEKIFDQGKVCLKIENL